MHDIDIDTRVLIEELERQGIHYEVADERLRVLRIFFEGQKPILIQRAQSRFRSKMGHFLALRKDLAGRLVAEAGVPIPETVDATDRDSDAVELLGRVGTVVVKPDDSAHGNGITTDVQDTEKLTKSLSVAREFSKRVLVQQQVTGQDIRVLIIGGKLAAALIRRPATVTGDGTHSIKQLIEIENQKPERGEHYRTDLNKIAMDAVERFVTDTDAVPDADVEVRVMGPANVGQGGTSEDITALLDPQIVEYSIRAAEACELEVAGVDFMLPEPKQPIGPNNQPYFIEINALPLLGFHARPNFGDSQPVARILLDWLKEQNANR